MTARFWPLLPHFMRQPGECAAQCRAGGEAHGGSPEAITTDGLRSYRAAMSELGNAEKQEVGRWANNRVENSHLSFRRRERAMLRFRRMKTLQKFASVHANVHNHFNQERHLVDRTTYKERRSAAPGRSGRCLLPEVSSSKPRLRQVETSSH
jgi:hypothetical protein